MDQSAEFRGYWFLPDKPEERAFGVLRCSPGDANLELQEALGQSEFRLDLPKYDILLGCVDGERQITLHDAFATSLDNIAVNNVFVGHRFHNYGEIMCREVRVQLAYLDQWAMQPGSDLWSKETSRLSRIDVRHDSKSGEMVVRVHSRPEILLHESGDIRIYLGLQCMSPVLRDVQTEATARQGAFIRAELAKPTPFDECKRIIREIADFVSLGVLAPARLGAIEVKVASTISPNRWVSIFGTMIESDAADESGYHGWPLFSYSMVRSRIQGMLGAWMDKARLLEPVRGLYSVIVRDAAGFMELRFLSIVQAVEVYHRRFRGGQYEDDDTYRDGVMKALLDAIPDGLPCDYKRSLESKIGHLNEYSLRKRIRSLLDGLGTEICEGLVGDAKAFAARVADTRNHHTHYSGGTSQVAAEGIEMLLLSLQLRIVMELCLLGELGLEHSDIVTIFRQCNQYRRLMDWFAELRQGATKRQTRQEPDGV